MTAPPPIDSDQETAQEDSTQQQQQEYPYSSLLQKLQSKAYQSLSSHPVAANTNNNASQDSAWDLSHDAQLATLLHEFTNHIVQRTHEVSTQIRKLQSSVNTVGVDVATVQHELMMSGRNVVMEQVIRDDDGLKQQQQHSSSFDRKEKGEGQTIIEEKQASESIEDDDDSAAEIARLEEEEKSAIQDGMKALSLFYDPKEARQSSDGTACLDNEPLGFDNDDALMDHGYEDVIGDNCYFYPSAEGDVFNQRPLPFIVGSSEFMESSCAGLDAVEDET